MRVLVGCEFSGTVRDAFARRGWDAWSCDLLPTERPGQHIQGDVLEHLDDGWDLAIFHPPCTYLSSSGLHWNKRVPGRAEKTEDALRFVRRLLDAPIPRIALENPIGCISTRIRRPSQVIQPYEFGHDASKATCLWLNGLPPLVSTGRVEPRIVNGRPRWANQTDGGQNRLGPSADRWALRSLTYPGIAEAMAEQWTASVLRWLGQCCFSVVPVVLASDLPECESCGEPYCDRCGQHYAECGCVGPHSEGWVVTERDGRLVAHPESAVCAATEAA